MFFTITAFDLIVVLILAFVIDLVLGEPPFAIHPVVWIGNSSHFLRLGPSKNRRDYGIFMAFGCILFAALIGTVATLILDTESIPALIR